MYMDKGGAAIHLDPPNHPFYPPNTRGSQREFFEVYPYILVCPTHIRLARLIVLFFNQQTTLEWFVGVLVLFFCFFCLR